MSTPTTTMFAIITKTIQQDITGKQEFMTDAEPDRDAMRGTAGHKKQGLFFFGYGRFMSVYDSPYVIFLN